MTTVKPKPNPYSFIERIGSVGETPAPPGKFRCTHAEATGVFVCKHLTVRDISGIETLQAAIQGGALTERSDALARWQASTALGFETKPEGFDPSKIRSEQLLHALYFELREHHAFFREAPLEGAFQFDPEAAF